MLFIIIVILALITCITHPTSATEKAYKRKIRRDKVLNRRAHKKAVADHKRYLIERQKRRDDINAKIKAGKTVILTTVNTQGITTRVYN